MGVVLLISAFNQRFSGGIWFIQDKLRSLAPTGNLIIKSGHTVSTKDRLQLAEYKMQTRYKMHFTAAD